MALLLIAWQDTKRVLRDPAGLLMTLAVPMVLIVALGLVAGHAPFQNAPAGGFDALSYIAPGMAMFFMMLSVRQSARTIVEDADRGVRDRLRSAPVSDASIAAGNTVSHVLLLFIQLAVLVGVASLLYGLRWGPAWGLLLLCLALAASAGGWVGMLVSLGRTPSRINALGMLLTLVFGILSRSFAAIIPTTPWSVARKVMDAFSRLARPAPAPDRHLVDPLSGRERAVLGLLARGLSNKEIAERLFLAEGTVKNHVSAILAKIDARDRTQAALKARELGLLEE